MRYQYKPKTLSGARKKVRTLLRWIADRDELLDRWCRERTLLAQLASEKPEFDNPLLVVEAQQIRDRILKLSL